MTIALDTPLLVADTTGQNFTFEHRPRLYARSAGTTSVGSGSTFRFPMSSVGGLHTVWLTGLLITQEAPSPLAQLVEELDSLRAVQADWDGYGAARPSVNSIETARAIVERAFEVGLTVSAVSPSAEGGVFIAFDGPEDRRANIECFNDETAYAATLAGEVTVWPVSTVDQDDLDAALQRIREHISPTGG